MKKKNVVLIMCDELRLDSLSFMGNPIVKTPNIDRLAKKSFVTTNTYCAAPLCVPSRVCLFTGQFVGANESVNNHIFCHVGHENNRNSSFIEKLDEEGYQIGLAGKNHTFTGPYFKEHFDYREDYHHWGKGAGDIRESDKRVFEWRRDDKRFQLDKKVFMAEGLIEGAEPFPEEECVTHRIAEDGCAFLEKHKDDPFFLYYSFPDPHWPNVVCEPYYSMYAPEDIDDVIGKDINWDEHPFKFYVQSRVNGFDKYTDLELKKIIGIYYGMITFIDKAVGMLLDKLAELGLEDDTAVIFTADHGNFGGNYGLVGKTGCFYDCLTNIPLILYFPELPGNGKFIDAGISNIDTLPTVFDYLGLEAGPEVQGVSFLDVLKGEKSEHREELFSEVGDMYSPPPIMSVSDYDAFAAKREKEAGWQWFIDYTVNGRSAMLKKGNFKYSYHTDDREELYDLKNDPYETVNLAQRPEYQKVKDELKGRLLQWTLNVPVRKYPLLNV